MIRLKFARFALGLLLVALFVPIAFAADTSAPTTADKPWADAATKEDSQKGGWASCDYHTPIILNGKTILKGDQDCSSYAVTEHLVCLKQSNCVDTEHCILDAQCGVGTDRECNTACIYSTNAHSGRCVCIYNYKNNIAGTPECHTEQKTDDSTRTPTDYDKIAGKAVWVGLCPSCANLLTYTKPTITPINPPAAVIPIALYDVSRIEFDYAAEKESADLIYKTSDTKYGVTEVVDMNHLWGSWTIRESLKIDGMVRFSAPVTARFYFAETSTWAIDETTTGSKKLGYYEAKVTTIAFPAFKNGMSDEQGRWLGTSSSSWNVKGAPNMADAIKRVALITVVGETGITDAYYAGNTGRDVASGSRTVYLSKGAAYAKPVHDFFASNKNLCGAEVKDSAGKSLVKVAMEYSQSEKKILFNAMIGDRKYALYAPIFITAGKANDFSGAYIMPVLASEAYVEGASASSNDAEWLTSSQKDGALCRLHGDAMEFNTNKYGMAGGGKLKLKLAWVTTDAWEKPTITFGTPVPKEDGSVELPFSTSGGAPFVAHFRFYRNPADKATFAECADSVPAPVADFTFGENKAETGTAKFASGLEYDFLVLETQLQPQNSVNYALNYKLVINRKAGFASGDYSVDAYSQYEGESLPATPESSTSLRLYDSAKGSPQQYLLETGTGIETAAGTFKLIKASPTSIQFDYNGIVSDETKMLNSEKWLKEAGWLKEQGITDYFKATLCSADSCVITLSATECKGGTTVGAPAQEAGSCTAAYDDAGNLAITVVKWPSGLEDADLTKSEWNVGIALSNPANDVGFAVKAPATNKILISKSGLDRFGTWEGGILSVRKGDSGDFTKVCDFATPAQAPSVTYSVTVDELNGNLYATRSGTLTYTTLLDTITITVPMDVASNGAKVSLENGIRKNYRLDATVTRTGIPSSVTVDPSINFNLRPTAKGLEGTHVFETPKDANNWFDQGDFYLIINQLNKDEAQIATTEGTAVQNLADAALSKQVDDELTKKFNDWIARKTSFKLTKNDVGKKPAIDRGAAIQAATNLLGASLSYADGSTTATGLQNAVGALSSDGYTKNPVAVISKGGVDAPITAGSATLQVSVQPGEPVVVYAAASNDQGSYFAYRVANEKRQSATLAQAAEEAGKTAALHQASVVGGLISATGLDAAVTQLASAGYSKNVYAYLQYADSHGTHPVNDASVPKTVKNGEASWQGLQLVSESQFAVIVAAQNAFGSYQAVKAAEGAASKAEEFQSETQGSSESGIFVDEEHSSCTFTLSYRGSGPSYKFDAKFNIQFVDADGNMQSSATAFDYRVVADFASGQAEVLNSETFSPSKGGETSGMPMNSGRPGDATRNNLQFLTSDQAASPTAFTKFWLVIDGASIRGVKGSARFICPLKDAATDVQRAKNQLPGLVSSRKPFIYSPEYSYTDYKDSHSVDIVGLFRDMPGISEITSGRIMLVDSSGAPYPNGDLKFGGVGPDYPAITIKILKPDTLAQEITNELGAGVNPWRNNAYDLGGGNYYGLANFWTIRKPVFCKALNSILGTTRDGGTVEIYAPSSALSFSFYWVPEAYYVEQGKNINTLMKQTGIFRIGPGGNCVKRLSWPLA